MVVSVEPSLTRVMALIIQVLSNQYSLVCHKYQLIISTCLKWTINVFYEFVATLVKECFAAKKGLYKANIGQKISLKFTIYEDLNKKYNLKNKVSSDF